MNKDFKELRTEFTRPSFREELKKVKKQVCCNCGNRKRSQLEYHHIVPLINGGTNNFSNIVVLCNECHAKAHSNVHKCRDNSKGGRPRKANLEDNIDILHKYFKCEITLKEAKKLIGIADKNKSTWLRVTKEYKEAYEIKDFRNNLDIVKNNGKLTEGKVIGYTKFLNGETIEHKYKRL